MLRVLTTLAVLILLTVGLALPALAIVHATTPIIEAGAVGASGGAAGGVAAFDNVSETPAPGPPMPAEGKDHARVP